MELLWLAIVFYTVGLGAVLYFRPAVMFNENGTWKEFGYQRDSRHTIFPFWLFVITWAIISYMLSMIVSSSLLGATMGVAATASVAAANSSPAHSYAAHMFDDVIEMPDESDTEEAAERQEPERQEPVRQEPVRQERTEKIERQEPVRQERQERSKPPPKEKPRPGYYVLEEGDQSKGLRKYVYYGPKPPAT